MEVLDNEFMDHHYPSSVLENLKNLWLSKRLCDATLEAGPVKFYVHRLILIAMIPGLNKLQICTTGKPLEVILPATIKAEALNSIVHYLYTGALHLTPQNASWVEQIIHLLGLVKLYPFCQKYQCYLKRKKMVTQAVELFKNSVLVLSESEKAVQVHYLESEQQLGCLKGQLSISNSSSVIRNISVVKKEESDENIKGIEAKNSELALNHSDFTLGTFLESSSKERLHFQICSNTKDGEIYEPNPSETTSTQRPSSETSTCTASETCMINDLLNSNEENRNALENKKVGKGTAVASLNESKTETCEKESKNVMLQHIKLEPVLSEDELESGVDRGNFLGKDKYTDGGQAVATQLNCQFTIQKLHTSNPDQPGNTKANGLSTISKEKEDFTIFCPLCLIYFNSRKSYSDHQSVCFDTFHHNQSLFRLEQKIHQFCNPVPRTNRAPYQSSRGGKVFSFVRQRAESATSSSTYTVPVSPDREQTSHVQQLEAQIENNKTKKLKNPVLEGNGGESGMIEDNQNIPLSLNECAGITSERMEEKLSTGSKKSLLSDLLRDDDKVMEESRQTENCNGFLQLNNIENTVNNTLDGKNDADDLKLKITDVWTLKDVGVHAHSELFPGDSQGNLSNKAEDQPEINEMEDRCKEASKFFALFDVETVGNKLYIKRKTTVGSQRGTQTCDQLKTRTDKMSRQKRKQVNAEANVNRNSSNVGRQEGREAVDEMANRNVLIENTENKTRECFSSDGKSGNEKIVITQTPIKKLTSIITAVSEGENKHLLKKKPGNYEDIKSRGSSSTENKCSMLPKSNISNASSIQKDHQTERKVYEFRESTTKVINQQVRGYLGIKDEKTSNKGRPEHQIHQTSVCSPTVSKAGELLCSSNNEVLTKQGEPKLYNLVNTYSCKDTYQNVGPLNYCRKSSLQEKIARIHRENCIVIPKQWKDWKEENSNKETKEQLDPKLMEVPPIVLKRVPSATDDLVNRNASCTSEVSRQYVVPLKKRKQY